MILKCYIENYGDRVFDLVGGTLITENFNETLDSATINITNLKELLNLIPYQKVKIFSVDNSFERVFLIDNFVSTELNASDKTYEYTINLFSETKLLEKIQLPNCYFRQSLDEREEKTLKTKIQEYLELYVPKIKKTTDLLTWDYDYLFSWQDCLNKFDDRLSKRCHEFSMSEPTLRDLLNQLFLSVGLLPKIINNKLDCLDFYERATKVQGKKYNITRSNSSDSYVNTLTSHISQALDENNFIRNEIIGFRDRDNVFLKHTENLKLTTSFGIESIEKLILNAYVIGTTGLIRANMPSGMTFEPTDLQDPKNDITILSDTNKDIENVYVKYYKATINRVANDPIPGQTVQYLDYGIASIPTLVKSVSFGAISLQANKKYTLNSEKPTDGYDYIVLEFDLNGTHYYYNTLIECYAGRSKQYGGTLTYYSASVQNLPFLYRYDISDIVFEESKRNLLNTDYRDLNTLKYDDFKNNYYTTLYYAYGDKEIKGFSNKWTEFEWYGSLDFNFMDTLWRTLVDDKIEYYIDNIKDDVANKFLIPASQINSINKGETIEKLAPHAIGQNDKDILGKILENLGIQESDPFFSPFALMFFSVSYRPFNELALTYPKEDVEIPYSIAQLDKQEGSIPIIDIFSEREFEKSNRLGNNLINISQPLLNNISDVFPLNSLIENSIIFTREIRFYEDFIEAHCVASQDYVLKNYFTSLQTNYRAFEYTNYESAVERKENKTLYVQILKEQYQNLDDNIKIISSGNVEFENFFTSALLHNDTTMLQDNSLKYAILGDDNKFYKTDLSIVTFKNCIAINYVEFDNASHGIYIKNPNDYEKSEQLGGYTQGWYINSREYNEGHFVGFANKNILKNDSYVINSKDELSVLVANSMKAPQLNELPKNVLSLVNSNKSDVSTYTFHKGIGEIINQTLQFVFEAPKEMKLFNSFFELNMLVYNGRFTKKTRNKYVVIFSDEEEITIPSENDLEEDFGIYGYATGDHIVFSLNNTKGKKYAHVCLKSRTYMGTHIYYEYIDILRFDLTLGIQGQQLYYFVINDTKTLKVYEENKVSHLLEQSREVAISSNRDLKRL